MFTEELACKIGIAYGLYKAVCQANGESIMEPFDFKTLCTDSIEEIRIAAGLVDENSVTG